MINKFKITKLSNFAAIKKLENELYLNDLTIFMGDNSAGKSYVAILFDRLINLERELKNVLEYKEIQNTEILKDITRLVDDIENKRQNEVELERKHTIKFSMLQDLSPVVDMIIKDFIRKHFADLISARLTIKTDYNFNHDVDLIVKRSETPSLYEYSILVESKISDDKFKNVNVEVRHIIEKNKHNKNMVIEQILEVLFYVLIKTSLGLPASTYLPASRTGYLHTYRILVKYALEKTFGKKNPQEILSLPDWILDFILKLSQKPTNSFSNSRMETNLSQIIEEIEKSVLHGKVRIPSDTDEIEFLIKNSRNNYKKKIELPYTSSSVSEMIPLVAFLKKNFIQPGQLLIIEEPEAHLSFENQKIVARIIASLVNSGVKVLITTHSDFLIFELNNIILAHSIPRDRRPEPYKLLSLDYKQVNIYNFLLDETGKSSTIKKVKVTREGIDNPKITKNLIERINTMNKLYELLDDEG